MIDTRETVQDIVNCLLRLIRFIKNTDGISKETKGVCEKKEGVVVKLCVFAFAYML